MLDLDCICAELESRDILRMTDALRSVNRHASDELCFRGMCPAVIETVPHLRKGLEKLISRGNSSVALAASNVYALLTPE